MERLTTRCSGYAVMAWEHEEKHTTQEWIDMLTDRLAAYEDTGIEPGEIYEVRFLIAAQRDPQKLARLRELVLADQNGQLVVLPCKVGDTVYAAETSPAIPLSVAYVGVYLDGADGGDWEALENIGKTVFLTREEADAVLKGDNGHA